LLSASRNFVSRIDVVEVSDQLMGKGEPLTLFLFTDSLEVGLPSLPPSVPPSSSFVFHSCTRIFFTSVLCVYVMMSSSFLSYYNIMC